MLSLFELIQYFFTIGWFVGYAGFVVDSDSIVMAPKAMELSTDPVKLFNVEVKTSGYFPAWDMVNVICCFFHTAVSEPKDKSCVEKLLIEAWIVCLSEYLMFHVLRLLANNGGRAWT